MGPCALDYSRTKTPDHFWTDPPADELIQRCRIPSGHSTPPSVRRPMLNFRSDDSLNKSTPQYIAKADYVESLHQVGFFINKISREYEYNAAVDSFSVNAGVSQEMPGYLSLHQSATGLIIKWTPNQLMNGFTNDENGTQDKNIYWDYALQVRLDEIVYVHCHQDSEAGGTVILVGQDGVQRPPIHFPKGGHMLAFLSCIETGLLPRGRLDPPLWSQRSGTQSNRRRRPLPALSENDEETTKDYVFRIIDNTNHSEILQKRKVLMDTHILLPTTKRAHLPSTSTSSESSSSKSLSIDQNAPDSPPSVCIQAVCASMRRQIISRAFYGWLAYCRHLSTVRTHLSGLVHSKIVSGEGASEGVTLEKWSELCQDGVVSDFDEIYRLTYFGGIAEELRKELWPYLLGHYKFGSTVEQRNELSEETKQAYENTMSEWLAVEAIVKQRDKETQANAIAKLSSESTSGGEQPPPTQMARDLSNEVFEDSDADEASDEDSEAKPKKNRQNTIKYNSDEEKEEQQPNEEKPHNEEEETCEETTKDERDSDHEELRDFVHNVIVTNASVDMSNANMDGQQFKNDLEKIDEHNSSLDTCIETHGLASPARSACVSPASSNGGVYSQELLETFGLNLHRIEKDVQRCDRNYWYFSGENLDKLRNVMCTYVWEHLDIGYMQGMCDLVAPLLVIFNDESLTYACFCHLMERMVENFPNGNAMDCHFANMRSLIQILDSEMYELMHSHGDYTHFYFCYRWFLLDFKRELVYPDVFSTWEVIWAAQFIASSHFVLFLALALLETYRDIILSNGMDFTDIIKFFNEMAERHDASAVLNLARDLVLQLQLLIENK